MSIERPQGVHPEWCPDCGDEMLFSGTQSAGYAQFFCENCRYPPRRHFGCCSNFEVIPKSLPSTSLLDGVLQMYQPTSRVEELDVSVVEDVKHPESPGDHDAGSDSTSFETWLAQNCRVWEVLVLVTVSASSLSRP
ncbi:hypothetical protein C8039_07795 [Halogeometricum sp. wsp3]|nr:hypothetical protein C8039_07795 [Halogeometricum sp. wsp3]